ncbi:carbon-nitrogen hydrolase [Spinellus fusiger]|nr:carbon-nitrogen hydrolase [Spinellus fusiger]
MAFLAAVGQFCATSCVATNQKICSGLVSKAVQQGAKMLFLPEASDFLSETKAQALAMTSSLEASSFLLHIQKAAKEHALWVSVGVHEKSEITPLLYNTHVVVDALGHVVASYRKVHLFDVDIHHGPRLMESETTQKGSELGAVLPTPLGNVGLQICYDLRFAEQSIAQRQRGADILTFPSAFTVKTGAAHWEPLLRARAIETQTYVVAAAQVGQHNAKRTSYGHAMIVDPWGTVIAQCPEVSLPSIALASIDLDVLGRIRTEMPILHHRRHDLYPHLGSFHKD